MLLCWKYAYVQVRGLWSSKLINYFAVPIWAKFAAKRFKLSAIFARRPIIVGPLGALVEPPSVQPVVGSIPHAPCASHTSSTAFWRNVASMASIWAGRFANSPGCSCGSLSANVTLFVYRLSIRRPRPSSCGCIRWKSPGRGRAVSRWSWPRCCCCASRWAARWLRISYWGCAYACVA